MDKQDLRLYIDTRIDDTRLDIDHRLQSAVLIAQQLQRKTDIQFESVTKATDLAREAAEKRFEGLNGSFKFIRDSQAEYVSFPQHEALDKRLALVETTMSNLQGRLWAIGVLVPLAITITSIAITIALRISGH